MVGSGISANHIPYFGSNILRGNSTVRCDISMRDLDMHGIFIIQANQNDAQCGIIRRALYDYKNDFLRAKNFTRLSERQSDFRIIGQFINRFTLFAQNDIPEIEIPQIIIILDIGHPNIPL